jgi:succinoglycan biosynthesis protein ExoL
LSIVFLLSHLPNPRMVKRVKSALTVGSVSVICWDRGMEIKNKNPLPEGVNEYDLCIKGNEGKPLNRLGSTFRFILAALKLLGKLNPSIIYTSKLDILFVAKLYSMLKNNKLKIVYEISDMHELVFESPHGCFRRLLKQFLIVIERLLCQSVSLLIVTSPGFYDEYYSNMLPKDKMMFIPNMPNTEVFNGYTKKHRGTFTIGWIGLVRYKEQMKLMIDAAKKCKVNVVIAGSGVDYFEIEQYSRNRQYVEFYGPYQYEREIASLYEKVDCICAVYDSSIRNVRVALPNRLYEAVFCGVPVIAASGTVLGNQVDELGIGLTVDAFNYEEMCVAINKLKNDIEFYNSKVKQCNKIKSEFSYDKYGNSLIEKLKILLHTQQ